MRHHPINVQMNLFGGRPCKQMIKYDGRSLDLTGLELPLGGPLNFELGNLKTEREMVQTAAEIAQLLDAAQFANCSQIAMVKDDKERVKLINQAILSQEQLVKFSLVMKLISTNPESESIQNALATWIASQTSIIGTLSGQVENQDPAARGGEARRRGGEEQKITAPSKEKIQSSIESAKRAEPRLEEAIQRGASSVDLDKIIEAA
jgi:hypothetical protein